MWIDEYLKDRSSHGRNGGPRHAVIGAFENGFDLTHYRGCVHHTLVIRIKRNSGVLELVIANVALSNGFIEGQLFTILVLMAVITTFATPLLLKWALIMPATGSQVQGSSTA